MNIERQTVLTLRAREKDQLCSRLTKCQSSTSFRDREGDLIMMKVLMLQKDIMILDNYAPHKPAWKCVR